MVIKHLENKIRLVGIICTAFLIGCIIISVSSIWTARTMVTEAQQKVYVLDGNVPILVNRTTMEETLDVEAKSHVEMFHHYFFTLAPDDKYIHYTMNKAMYLVDETGLAQYNTLKEKGFYSNILGTSAVFSIFCDSIAFNKEKMNVEKKIEKWCMDGKFMDYANRRMKEEICHVPENHILTPQCDELMERFECDDRYAAPLATYLTYRLQCGMLQRNARKRQREIWWVFVQVALQGFYVNVFSEEFGPLVTALRASVMPMLHDEYVRLSNDKKR